MKQLVLAIDIQQEYTAKDRPFYISNIYPSLLNAKKILNSARLNAVPIWHIQHQRKEGEGVFSAQSGFINFISGFEPLSNEPIFIKHQYSSFSCDEFLQKVTAFNPQNIIVLGYGSSMCCLCTIIDGVHRGFNFILAEDASASRSFPFADSEEMHFAAIKIIRQYATVDTSQKIISQFSDNSPA